MLHAIIIHRSFFFYPFQTMYRNIKQIHFPVIIFHCLAEKKQTTTLGLASHSRNYEGLWPVIISPVHGKTPHFALCSIMSPLDRDVSYPQRCSSLFEWGLQLHSGWVRSFVMNNKAFGNLFCKFTRVFTPLRDLPTRIIEAIDHSSN